MELFNNMSNFMKKPNIIVHLEVSPEESMRRIKARSRDCETGITLKYLQDLHTACKFKWMNGLLPLLLASISALSYPLILTCLQ